MTSAVWLLAYDVADANAESYLSWFHDEHIPDKLSRPGYEWAAHYRGPARSAGDAHGYLALFGARTTRTFLDPCPAQHRKRQDALTRTMMSHRIGTVAGVFALEWSDGEGSQSMGVPDTAVRAELIDAGDRDEALGAWCIQTWLPAWRTAHATSVAHKWVNVAGTPRHLLLTGHSETTAAACEVTPPSDGEFSAEVSAALDSTLVVYGDRIWPQGDVAST